MTIVGDVITDDVTSAQVPVLTRQTRAATHRETRTWQNGNETELNCEDGENQLVPCSQ